MGSRQAPDKGANIARFQYLNFEGALEQAWGVILGHADVDTRESAVDLHHVS